MKFLSAYKSVFATIVAVSCALASPVAGQRVPAVSDSLFTRLKAEHPRLILTGNRLAELRAEAAAEGDVAEGIKVIRRRGEEMLLAPAVRYPDGALLETSRLMLERVFVLAFLAQMDGDVRWAKGAFRELQAAATFPDWKPSSFLGVAEMAAAFAIGYDWLYGFASEAERVEMRRAIREKAFGPALIEFEQRRFWTDSRINWNPVCNGGLALAALAVGTEEPLAESLLHRTLLSLQLGGNLESFGPDGAYPEGIGYWGYATQYLSMLFSGLRTALGNDFGLPQVAGLSHTGLFPFYCEAPGGRMFNFGDAKSDRIYPYWMGGLAAAYGVPLYGWFAQMHTGFHVLDVVWYDSRHKSASPDSLPLAKRFRGPELAIFRGSWTDSTAAYLAFKAGSQGGEHSHLDAGSFVFEAEGVRWATDLGPDNYSLPGYFTDYQDSARRFSYYRIRAQGHNTLTLNPGMEPDQERVAASRILSFDSIGMRAVADLAPAYASRAAKVLRGAALLAGGTALIQDEIRLRAPGGIWWRMHTEATVQVAGDRRSAMLMHSGRRLWMTLVDPPEGTRFSVLAAEPLPGTPRPAGQDANAGISVVAVHLSGATEANLAVWLVPLRAGENPPLTMPTLQSLDATGGFRRKGTGPCNGDPGFKLRHGPRGSFLDVSGSEKLSYRVTDLAGRMRLQGEAKGPGITRLEAGGGAYGPGILEVRMGHEGTTFLLPPRH